MLRMERDKRVMIERWAKAHGDLSFNAAVNFLTARGLQAEQMFADAADREVATKSRPTNGTANGQLPGQLMFSDAKP